MRPRARARLTGHSGQTRVAMMSQGCAGCGFDVAAEFAFCPKCGRKLAALCGSCGTSSPPDFAFCPRCGAGLGPAEPASALAARPIPAASSDPAHDAFRPRPAPEGDAGGNRRPATVLFADLAGFTAIGERLDPEDVRAFQNDLFAALSAAIERYEGFVEKYVGDAVMAVFGAPIAHEDDPERALRAALDMHAQMPAISARWSRRSSAVTMSSPRCRPPSIVVAAAAPRSSSSAAMPAPASHASSRSSSLGSMPQARSPASPCAWPRARRWASSPTE